MSIALSTSIAAAGPSGELPSPPPPPLFADPAIEPGASAPSPATSPILQVRPPRDARVADLRPRIEVYFRSTVPLDEISLAIDSKDVTADLRLEGTTVLVELREPLQPGPHVVRLFVQGMPVIWTFVCEPGPVAGGALPGPGLRTDWSFNSLGTLTTTGTKDDVSSTARLRLNSRAEVQGDGWSARENLDFALRQDFQGGSGPVQESRNYLIGAGLRGRSGFGAEGLAGFFSPDFLDQSQLLAIGMARGGVEAKVLTPVGSASAYRSYDSRPAGVVAGGFGPSQSLWAGAVETPAKARFSLRLMGLHAVDDAALNTAGGEGFALGALGRAALSPAATLLLEAARGKYDPNPGGPDSSRSGFAVRLGFLGAVESWSYIVNLRQTDDSFVNPANRGFAIGAASDRAGGDATVTKLFGSIATGLSYRHLRGGSSSGFISPGSREDGGNLFASSPIGSIATVSAVGNATWSRSDEDPARGLSRTDRLLWGASLSASETWQRFLFSESYAYQRVRDRVSGAFDQSIHTGTITAGGPIVPALSFSVVAFATRSEAAPPVGRTDQISLSLQPTVLLRALWLSLQPRLAYLASSNTGLQLDAKTEQAQLLASWEPPWQRSIFALQASGDWSRSSTSGTFFPPTFRFLTNLVIRWSAGSPGLAPAAPPPPAGPYVPGATLAAPPPPFADSRAPGSSANFPPAARPPQPPLSPPPR